MSVVQLTAAVILLVGGLLAIVVAATGQAGKYWKAEFGGPPTIVRQVVVFVAGLVTMTIGILVFFRSPESQASSSDGGGATGSGASGRSASQPAAPNGSQVLKQGDASVTDGDKWDLETGARGKEVTNSDVSYSDNGSWKYLMPSNGLIAETGEGATPDNCRKALKNNPMSKVTMIGSGDWYCVTTTAQHLAAVQIVSRGDYGAPALLHYIVWNV